MKPVIQTSQPFCNNRPLRFLRPDGTVDRVELDLFLETEEPAAAQLGSFMADSWRMFEDYSFVPDLSVIGNVVVAQDTGTLTILDGQPLSQTAPFQPVVLQQLENLDRSLAA